MARVLVVDDHEPTHALLERVLGRAGHTTGHARGPDQALELLRNDRFDAMVVDISMPDVDGIQFVQLVRTDSTAQSPTPVIFYSAFLEVTNARKRLADLGPVTLVAKDGDVHELTRAVETAIQSAAARPDPPAAVIVQLRPGLTAISVDRSGTRIFELHRRQEVLLEAGTLDELLQLARAAKLD